MSAARSRLRRSADGRPAVRSGSAGRSAQRGARLGGDADAQHGFARLGVDGDRAAVALDDDALCDVETQTGAFAHVLSRVEDLERAGRYLQRHPRAGVTDLDDDIVPLGPRRQPQRACSVHRVDGVVDEVGPHLVEFAGVSLDVGDAGAVVTDDRDTVAELVPEHYQGALEAVRYVDPLYRCPVHLRVGPDRGDKTRD